MQTSSVQPGALSKFVAAVQKGGLMLKLRFNPGMTTV